MQIHDLNEKTLTNPAYVAFDDGTDTYKVEFNDTVESAAQSAVAATDLTQNTVGFTSGDSLSPSGWTSVSQITTNSTLATLFNRISTMVKNVRYIWNLLGSSSFSNVASTLTGAIGNTALPTTAQTLSGAIAEHESDISTLNSKIYYEHHSFRPTGNIPAGTIGTRGLQLSFSNPHPTDQIIGIVISYIGDSSKYFPVVFHATGNIYCNYYRATANAITATEAAVDIYTIYEK